MSTLTNKIKYKYNPFNDIRVSFNPLYVKENSHNKFTLLHWLICNAEWKIFNSFWLLKQNTCTFSQSCANGVTKSKRTSVKKWMINGRWHLNLRRTWWSWHIGRPLLLCAGFGPKVLYKPRAQGVNRLGTTIIDKTRSPKTGSPRSWRWHELLETELTSEKST